jgi:tRNA pseudouridine38-40 synthase
VNRIAVGIEYDGYAFVGWQSQPNLRSVEQVLRHAIEDVAAAPVALICAGRTDAGVHALAQVAHFDSAARRSTRAWLLGVNASLPPDVSLRWAAPVPAHFHARFSAERRRYLYRVVMRSTRPALLVNRAWWIRAPLQIEPMRAAAQRLLGEHDFSSFRAAECQSKSPVRRVEEIAIESQGESVWIRVTANAFLHHMVRNIVGLLVAVGTGERSAASIAELLAARDRRLAPPTAPASGLYLHSVQYPAAFGLPATSAPDPL